MGPHSFERGNSYCPLLAFELVSPFNGASLIRARKLYESDILMGWRYNLQWGLTHSSEETYNNRTMAWKVAAFNGASLIRARKLSTGAARADSDSRLQWGLTHSSEETSSMLASDGVRQFLQWGLTHSSEETCGLTAELVM